MWKRHNQLSPPHCVGLIGQEGLIQLERGLNKRGLDPLHFAEKVKGSGWKQEQTKTLF